MKKAICLHLSFMLLLLSVADRLAETPETILIRRTLGNDVSGHRRANMDLILSGYDEDFVAYQGGGNHDPRAWAVAHEDLASFSRTLGEDLRTNRYETERTLPFIHVRAEKAMVTSIDSGQVIDRRTGDARYVRIHRFWTLRKIEDEWLITGLVEDIGDTSLAVTEPGERRDEIAAFLQREARAWNSGSPGAIAAFFDEEFIGYDGYTTFKPATWKIVFADAEELEQWLDRRLENTTYELNREVIFTRVGGQGQEALVLTREKVSTAHEQGDVTHAAERYVLWTLSRRSGGWKITNMLYNLGFPD